MKLHTSSSLRALAIAAACCGLFAQHSAASKITFVSSCDRQINLYDNAQEVPMAPGAALARDVSDGFKGMFRAGKTPQATLAEFTHAGGKLWYDISIIPTSATQGSEYCPSLAACKQLTGGTGYNEPMQIAPQSNTNGAHCRVLTCLSDGCDDAYQFPKDDTRTHNCPGATDFVVTFCPNGSGSARAVPAPAPVATTTAPVATTAPPRPTTAAPTTQPPTPVPTTAAPTTPVVVPAANSSIKVERDADQLVAGSAASQATGASIDVIVNPELATQTQVPVFDITASVPTPEPTQAPVTNNVNTQSSNTTGGSTLTTVFVAAVLVLAAAVAIVAIVVVRRKKHELDAQTEKSPIMNPGLATL